MELSIDELYDIILIITKCIMDNEKEMQKYKDDKHLTEYYSKRVKEATDLKDKVFELYIEKQVKPKLK